MPFDILFGVLFHQWAWKLAAAATIAEIFRIKAGFNLALQAGLAFAIITNKTSCTWILIFLAADAVDSAWRKKFGIDFFRHFHFITLNEIFIGGY
jgi:hypothetical protein